MSVAPRGRYECGNADFVPAAGVPSGKLKTG